MRTRRTGPALESLGVSATPIPTAPAPNASGPGPSSTESTIEHAGSEDDEALEAEEARLIKELDRRNRKERIGVLRRQLNRPQARPSAPSEEAEDGQALSSQRSATTRTQSEVDFDLPLPKRRGQLPPRTKEPPEYRGKSRAEYTNFLWACDLNFRASLQAFGTEEEKVTFAIQYLKGSPQDDWRRYEVIHGLDNTSWSEFTDVLKEALGDPENRSQTTYSTYFAAMQRPNQSARDFAKYLELLEEDLNDLPEELRFQRLLGGFRKETRDTISANAIAPRGRLALIAQASRIEESLRKGLPQAESRQPTGSQGTTRYQPKPNAKEESRRKAETEELKEKRRKEGGCFECGEVGHIAVRCPNWKVSSASSSKSRHPPYRPNESGKESTR
jgi:hypothetical protein